MAPTIVADQQYKTRRSGSSPKVGDIVYFAAKDGSRLIRRVVGLGGDSMSVSEGWVYRNGEGSHEPFVKYNDARLTVGAMLVPKGAVFVIGDNRNQLADQFWGLVPVGDIKGFVTP